MLIRLHSLILATQVLPYRGFVAFCHGCSVI